MRKVWIAVCLTAAMLVAAGAAVITYPPELKKEEVKKVIVNTAVPQDEAWIYRIENQTLIREGIRCPIETASSLPSENEAIKIAKNYLRKKGVLENDVVVSVEYMRKWVFDDNIKTAKEFKTGMEVKFLRVIDSHPTCGKGDYIRVIIGDGGKVLGYQKLWRELVREEKVRLSAGDVIEELKSKKLRASEGVATSTLRVDSIELCYWMPAVDHREFVVPVYKLEGVFLDDEGKEAGKFVYFGPENMLKRAERSNEVASSTSQTKGTVGTFLTITGDDDDTATVAVEAIDDYSNWPGLDSYQYRIACARNFTNTMQSKGIDCDFFFTNDAAWDTDFEEYDDEYVDITDLLFYSGCGGYDAIYFNYEDSDGDSISTPCEMKYDGTMLGTKDLEWLCLFGDMTLPRYNPSSPELAAKWAGVLNGGLHHIHGFWSQIGDSAQSADFGKKFAEYLTSNYTIMASWVYAADDTLPSGTTIESYVVSGTESDHFWGHGSVASDPSGTISVVIYEFSV